MHLKSTKKLLFKASKVAKSFTSEDLTGKCESRVEMRRQVQNMGREHV